MAFHSTQTRLDHPVGASPLAMDVHDDAFSLEKRGVLETIASQLAPTERRTKKSPTIRSGSL
ncbi:hypothetical protein EJA72_19330 [Pseudomonas sp. PB120]|nr:hypothetical protein [Pseudomonas sp. PB120]